MNVSRFGFAARTLACDSCSGGFMCNIRWYVISVIDLLIEAVVGEIVVNNTVEASSFFCTPVGQQRFKRRGHGIQFSCVE